MNTFFKVSLAALYVFPSSIAEHCNCNPEGTLETLTQVFEHRDAWTFLSSSATLYLLYLPATLRIGAAQCVTSTLREPTPVYPEVKRRISYTNASLQANNRQNKDITLTMGEKNIKNKRSTYFTTHDFPRIGEVFPVVYSDSRCLIYQILRETFDGKTGCALWVKQISKDNLLLYCKFIYNFFCGVSHRTVYAKQTCDTLVPEEEKS
uniref:Putative lipocalin-7 1 n=1 Tax=Ixodes ricinus TaxID=34613 RepID=V5H622_IXORI